MQVRYLHGDYEVTALRHPLQSADSEIPLQLLPPVMAGERETEGRDSPPEIEVTPRRYTCFSSEFLPSRAKISGSDSYVTLSVSGCTTSEVSP